LLVYMTISAKPLEVIEPGFGAETKDVWVAAKEVRHLAPGDSVELNPEDMAFPAPLSRAPMADYQVMALLDADHNAAYTRLTAGDVRSAVRKVTGLDPSRAPLLELRLSERVVAAPLDLPKGSERLEFNSPALSAFWGRPVPMRGIVVLPPGYATSRQRYPTVYWTHGFGGDLAYLASEGARVLEETTDGKLPPMIWVMLDQSCAGGTHEFADSVNNGPWGHTLTHELIPYLERKYRMDARPRGRFLTGHSSGGWATLWLQVTYPRIFGGTWSTSPDPVDFRDFTNIDLTKAPKAYTRADGSATPLVRMGGRDVETFEEFSRQEAAIGDYGGQVASFNWVFSPRGPDGRPLELFDRQTGLIHREVADYWLEHYDISRILTNNAKRLVKQLRGKIHIVVGTADTFYLDDPVRLMQTAITPLGYQAKFTFLAGRTHFDLFSGGLMTRIGTEMYDVARPGHTWKTKVAPDPATELAK
jgi:S-formylglutathione hydrolase FrmB